MKITRVLLLGLLLCLSVASLPVSAQDTQSACTQDNVNLSIALVAKSAQDAQAAADPKAAVDILAAASAQIAALQAECAGLSFKGTDDTVIGPLELPKGIYKVLTTADNYVITSATALEGECGQGTGSYLSESVFLAIDKKAETIFTSNGCSALIEMKASNWTLEFQKIK